MTGPLTFPSGRSTSRGSASWTERSDDCNERRPRRLLNVEIRERLVNVEGRCEFAGDLARVKATRGMTLIELGDTERGKREAREAVAVLRAEVKRTGRADLKAMLEWTARHLGEQ